MLRNEQIGGVDSGAFPLEVNLAQWTVQRDVVLNFQHAGSGENQPVAT